MSDVTSEKSERNKVQLRPYQEQAVAEVRSRVAAGARRVLIVAPTGAGKCVTPDTMVWSDGLRRFGDVWGDDRIATQYSTGQVSGWYDDGERDGYKVTLESGLVIDGTPAHRVWVRSELGYEGWRHIGELGPGDYVAVARGRADFGAQTMPLDEAYALGLVIADGSIHGRTLNIDKQQPVLQRVRPVIQRWGAMVGNPGGVPRIRDVSPRHAVLRAHGGYRELFLDRYGLTWQSSSLREVPEAVLRGTREVVAAFLRGYFDGDGYADKEVAISTASPLLATQVHQLLLGLGIYARRRLKQTTHLPAHILEVRDVEAFHREVGFTPYGLTKDRSFAKLLETKRNTNVDIVPGVGGILRSAARMVPRRTRRDDAWRHVAAYYESRRPSYPKLAELAAALPESPERDELMRLLIEHRAWSKVQSIEPSRQHRIDCEVPDQHAFVGNGLVNHNTTIAAHIMAKGAEKGSRVLFMAHRRELIGQAYDRLLQLGIPEDQLGVIMANDPRRRPVAQVQVASVDTLRHRPKPHADIVFTDEAHRATSPSYRAIAEHYPKALHLGLTATPFRANGQGLSDAYDDLVVVTSPKKLIEQGFLVEPRVFTVPPELLPDLSGVRTRRGDYDQKALAEAVDSGALVGNLVEHWKRHAVGMKTVVFAVSVAHSKRIAAQFRAAGVAAEHLDGTTPKDEREAILARLESGETTLVSGVSVLAEGWDMPSVKCAILARPTKSTGLYLQQAGRILRPYQGQQAIILDHGGCVLEHGLPQDDRQFTLEGKKRKIRDELIEPPAKTCPDCFAVVHTSTRGCPECGHVFEVRERNIIPNEEEGELVEVGPDDLKRMELDRLHRVARENGYKEGWVFYRFRDKFGEAPPRSYVPPEPSEPVLNVRAASSALRKAARAGKQLGWDDIDAVLGWP